MSAPTIDAPSAPAVDDAAVADLEAAYAAPAAQRTEPSAAFGIGELFVFASFASLAVGFLVLVALELG